MKLEAKQPKFDATLAFVSLLLYLASLFGIYPALMLLSQTPTVLVTCVTSILPIVILMYRQDHGLGTSFYISDRERWAPFAFLISNLLLISPWTGNVATINFWLIGLPGIYGFCGLVVSNRKNAASKY